MGKKIFQKSMLKKFRREGNLTFTDLKLLNGNYIHYLKLLKGNYLHLQIRKLV